ncbi:hypothetical protein niasHS_016537 [Heterodera schachtii]|uniref:Helitron helicase-like domain-containing protein n=1 Tax=Heterodera schachtii TaxID=97005 RepID=A0ABD2I6A2_HETSC
MARLSDLRLWFAAEPAPSGRCVFIFSSVLFPHRYRPTSWTKLVPHFAKTSGLMPSKQEMLKKRKKDEHLRRTEKSGNPNCPILDNPLSADGNGAASPRGFNTPNLSALQLSMPASSIGSKRRCRHPKAGDEAVTASQNSVSSVDTQFTSATQNIESSPHTQCQLISQPRGILPVKFGNLNDGFAATYLAYLASISQRKVVVVDPMVWENGLDRVMPYKNMTFGYDLNVPAEVILLPVHFPGHWTLIVHDVQCGTHFADSLPTPYGRLDWQLTDKIRKIISDILPSVVLTGIVNDVNLTVQHDGNSCGYFVCLYAESWLMNNRTFDLPDLSIDYEKRRILWHINELYGTDNVPYHPREGVPTPCSIVYRHADDAQSTSKAAEPMEVYAQDDLMIIEPQMSGQAFNAILTQDQVAGENQADSRGVVSDSCMQQEPIAQADDVIFVRPKTPPRRSLRVQKRLSASASRSPSPRLTVRPRANTLGPATPLTKRCLTVHNGWHCAAAAAKHFPEYSHSGNLGDHKCPHCGALLFLHEDSSLCCRKGRVVLPKLNPHPQELMELIVGENQPKQGKEFVRRMSRYNNLLQFASVSAGNKPSPAGGPMAVILNGEFHRRISSMQAGTTQIPGFGQLYILDPVEAMEMRRNNPIFTGEMLKTKMRLCRQAREQLQELLKKQNPEELRFFRMTLLNERRTPAALKDPKLHPHQIITPSTGEGMFAIHADPTGVPPQKGIWVENRQGQLNEIAPFNPWTDNLTYPLIKPMGDDGYITGVKYARPPSRKRKSDQDVVSLFDSEAESDNDSCETQSVASSDAGPDMDLRVSTPKNLLQYLVNQYNKQQARQNPNAQLRTVDDIGSVVRFNDNNVNCLQYWKKMYENCNTIFARCHNPKKARLFITFTNNREWPEFKANLYNNGQVFTDRFDMWMRVWISKIDEFREELYEKKFFGTILGSGELTLPSRKCTAKPALYYRPAPQDGGANIEVNGLIYDNSQVVPYNPYVLLRYRVHHNVLFAYGPGHCYVECKEESGNKIGIDKPAQYAKINFRGATEAYAVVNSTPYVRLSHHFVKLAIHLPNQQRIVYRAFQLVSKAQQIQQGTLPETQCSAYWKQWQNEWRHDPKFKDMLFEKVPEQFRWDKDKWVLYKRKPIKRPPIGRIVPVPPKDPERFALYSLMRHFPGDQHHLKMVNGQPCTSFTDAAIRHGLLEDDKIWDKTLAEAALPRCLIK